MVRPVALALVLALLSGCATLEGYRHFQLGTAALDRGDLGRAVLELELAAQLTPERSEIFNHLGIAYAAVGRRDEALSAFQHAVALDCDNQAAAANLAAARASQPGAQEFSYEELHAAVEEASKAGLKVAAHAHSAAGAKVAIRAGVASIEHGSFLDEEALQMMKEHGTFLVPDMYDHEIIMAGKQKGYLDEFIEKERPAWESQQKVFRRALELGVRIAFGTDAAVIPHGDNGRQFAVYVQHGMTPLAAIRSATIDAAELLGWADKIGTIEPGNLADIIAVRANPLEEIRTLEQVPFVMKDGQIVKKEFR